MADALPFGLSPLLTREQAATYLSLSPKTLEGYSCKGGGPKFVRYGRKAVHYRVSDLDAWIESKLVTEEALDG